MLRFHPSGVAVVVVVVAVGMYRSDPNRVPMLLCHLSDVAVVVVVAVVVLVVVIVVAVSETRGVRLEAEQNPLCRARGAAV